MNKKIIKSLLVIFILSISLVGATYSFFTSEAFVSNNKFSTGHWNYIVINEVYYDVDGRTYPEGQGVKTEEEGKNEWIELYNPTSHEISIKNYKIGTTAGEYTINANVSISPKNFALLSHDNSTWHFWGGASVPTVNLGGSIQNDWILNDGDWIYIKDTTGNIIDEMSFGSNSSAFYPACPDIAEGSSLERTPVGKDTNTANDFSVKVLPTPGS